MITRKEYIADQKTRKQNQPSKLVFWRHFRSLFATALRPAASEATELVELFLRSCASGSLVHMGTKQIHLPALSVGGIFLPWYPESSLPIQFFELSAASQPVCIHWFASKLQHQCLFWDHIQPFDKFGDGSDSNLSSTVMALTWMPSCCRRPFSYLRRTACLGWQCQHYNCLR